MSNEKVKKCLIAGGLGAVGIISVTAACAVLAPVVLPAIGFTSAGIAPSSLAASLQVPAVVAGSPFAIAQSTGALGPSACALVGIKVGLFAGISGAAIGIAGVTTCMAGNGVIKQFTKT